MEECNVFDGFAKRSATGMDLAAIAEERDRLELRLAVDPVRPATPVGFEVPPTARSSKPDRLDMRGNPRSPTAARINASRSRRGARFNSAARPRAATVTAPKVSSSASCAANA